MIQAATDDGFPEFSYLVVNRPDDELYFELNIKSQAWNYCQMLRYLVETQQTGVILYDDRFIKDWINLQCTYDVLRSDEAPNPVILQLDYYFSGHFNQGIKRRRHGHVPYIQQGPTTASENAMVYSPDGAEWFLARILEPENEGRNIESTIARLATVPTQKTPLFLERPSRFFFDRHVVSCRIGYRTSGSRGLYRNSNMHRRNNETTIVSVP